MVTTVCKHGVDKMTQSLTYIFGDLWFYEVVFLVKPKRIILDGVCNPF